jgi:glutathione-regulated potassium-efflux system ancillary protein KefF
MAETPSNPAPPLAGEVLVITAHPAMSQSRVNRRLRDVAQRSGTVVRDLYRLYPDYLIDIAAEQAALARARLVVWQHPLHWYGMPPLMKLWVDEVLAFGWAYGPGGTALRGKDLWLVTSTGSAEASYRPGGTHRHFFDAFLPPYEQTAALCGLRFLPPMVLHGAHRVAESELAAHVEVFAQRLASYPDWPELAGLGECPECEVPSDERPHAAEAEAA